jgi:Ribose 5-phosphate isomerase A (phosphoriboisomerase A)
VADLLWLRVCGYPALARRSLDIVCAATSPRTEYAARELGLRIEDVTSIDRFDITIDGADQIAPGSPEDSDSWVLASCCYQDRSGRPKDRGEFDGPERARAGQSTHDLGEQLRFLLLSLLEQTVASAGAERGKRGTGAVR